MKNFYFQFFSRVLILLLLLGAQGQNEALAQASSQYFTAPATPTTGAIFVKPTATGNGTGVDWDNAIGATNLHDAIEAGGKIYMAEGIYKPTSIIRLKSKLFGHFIYGGFPLSARGKNISGYNPLRFITRLFNPIGGGDLFYSDEFGADRITIQGLELDGSHGNGAVIHIKDKFNDFDCNFIDLKVRKVTSSLGGIILNKLTRALKSKILIKNCIFDGNNFDRGSGLYVSDVYHGSQPDAVVNTGSYIVEKCSFFNNKARLLSGALSLTNVFGWTLKHNTFCNNTTEDYGGAIYCDRGGENILDGCKFNDNTARLGGGALYAKGAIFSILRSVFKGNSCSGNSSYGGGIFGLKASLFVNKTRFLQNFAAHGGGIYNKIGNGSHFGSKLKLKSRLFGCIFSGNKARSYGGGALNFTEDNQYNLDYQSWDISECDFLDNEAHFDHKGGAIFNKLIAVKLGKCKFFNNKIGGYANVKGCDLFSGLLGSKFRLLGGLLQLGSVFDYDQNYSANAGGIYDFDNSVAFSNTGYDGNFPLSSNYCREDFEETTGEEVCFTIPQTADINAELGASGSSGFCFGCSVSHKGNLLDDNLLNAATINIPIGLFGSAYVDIKLDETYPAGIDAGFVADANGGLAGLFSGVKLISYLDGQQQEVISGSNLFNILGFGGNLNVAGRFNKPFNKLRFQASALANVFSSYKIRYAYVKACTIEEPEVIVEEPITPLNCSEKNIVAWDLDACAALENAYDFSEFQPTFIEDNCNNVSATNIFRNNANDYYHSCVQGVSGSGLCVSGTYVDYLPENSVHTLRFSATVGSPLSKLEFYAISPKVSNFITGSTKNNNYLRKYAIRVRNGGNLVFEKKGLALSNHDWTLQSIDFGTALAVNEATTFDFELVAYDPVYSSGDHRVWDLDEIKLFGCCAKECEAKAGQLAAVENEVCLVNGMAMMSATPAGNMFVPTGYETIYVLTSGSNLVIEQAAATPQFTVDAAGDYTIHTLVAETTDSQDPNFLDLGIIDFGVTTGVAVNSLLLQGGGNICAALDVAGAPVKVVVEGAVCPVVQPNINILDLIVDENEMANVQICLDRVSDEDVIVQYITSDSTAMAGSDYTLSSGIATILAGQTCTTVTVSILDDEIDENDEAFKIEIFNAQNGFIIDKRAIIVIKDNDEAPVPNIAVNDITVSEAAGTANVQICVDAVSNQAVSVQYATAGGTATMGLDFTVVSGTATILAGETCATIVIPITDDQIDENDETFVVNISNAQNANIVVNQGIATIIDNDNAPLPNIFINNVAANEAAGTANVQICLDAVSSQAVSVQYATAGGTATTGLDFTATAGTATILAGETCTTIVIPITDDQIDENDETFVVNLSNPQNANIADNQGEVIIIDNDDAPVPNIFVSDVMVNEGVGTASIQICLDVVSNQAVSVQYTTIDGLAITGLDYTASNGTATILAGETCTTVVIPIIDDQIDENDENFLFVIGTPQNGNISDGEAVVTIIDNDETPLPMISINDVTVNENAGTASLTISIPSPSNQPITVNFITADGSATNAFDYASVSSTVTIPAGQTTAMITIPILDDQADENDETFVVNISNPQNAIIADNQGTVTINDNDDAPINPNILVNDVTVNENAGTATIQFSLSQSSNEPVSVLYVTLGNTATTGTDFTATGGTISFPIGQTTASITVPIVDDQIVEGAETFFINLLDSQNGNIVDNQIVVTIIDNDDAPLPAVSINDVQVNEGAGTANLTVSIPSPVNQPVSVAYVTSDGSATNGMDYTATSGTATIPPGQTTTTITIPVTEDQMDENDETFVVNLSNPQNANIADNQGTITIIDNDDAPVTGTCTDVIVTGGASKITITNIPAGALIDYNGPATGWGLVNICDGGCSNMEMLSNLAAGDYNVKIQTFNPYCFNQVQVTVTEGGDEVPTAIIGDNITIDEDAGTVTIPVTISNPTDQPVSIDYTTVNGTANDGLDYTTTNGTLTIPAGQTTGAIIVPIIDDQANEMNETFTVNFSNPQNVTLPDNQSLITIIDNDAPVGLPSVMIGDITVNEDAGTATLSLNIPSPANQTITVNYNTADGSATGGIDYTATSGTATIMAGQTTTTITIPILEDQVNENDETFVVNLSNPQNANIADNQGTVTIIDNDDAPVTGTCNDVVVTGGAGKITLTNVPAGAIVDYGGPATGWGLVRICAGNCTSMEMVAGLAAGTYSVKIQTFNPYCFNQVNVEVTEEGNTTPTLSIGDVTVNEDAGTATVQLNLSSPLPSSTTVDYSTADDSALAGEDYTPVSGTATIPANSTSTTISIPIIDNDIVETTESFIINFINPSNATLPDNNARVTILDDDMTTTPSGDCNSVVVTGGQGEISISEVPSNAKIEYSGPSTGYQTILVCDQDCASSTVLNGLDRGNYNVVVQTFAPYCYKLYPVTVTEGGANNPCEGIGDADGDGICDDVDNCPNTPNADQADEDNNGIGNVCEDNVGGNLCDDAYASMANGQLTVSGLNAPITILKIFDSSWETIFECNGNKCPETVTFRADPNEVTCHVDIQFYNADWSLICERRITLTASGSASSRNAPQLNFAAYRSGRSVEVEWLTNSGWRNSHFELERSVDGANFEFLQTIENMEETDDLAHYTELDLTPQMGDNYYRIKEVRLDGTVEYTDIEKVNFSIDLDNFSMYPNPARDELFLSLKGLEDRKVAIQLINGFGQVLEYMDIEKVLDTNIQLPIENIPSGFYQVVVKPEGKKPLTRKLIIEKMY